MTANRKATPLEVLFFDVGNTLLFQNYEKTLRPLLDRGIRPTQSQLFGAERFARQETDLLVAKTRRVDQQYWENYYGHLLKALQVTDIGLRLELIGLARTSGNWDRLAPGAHEVLESLGKHYRLAVISNSDGRMNQRLASSGLAHYFEHVIDSGNVGFEKPAPEIFHAALTAMQVQGAASIYIGDIYSVDYLGAAKVQMRGLLMDVAGVYAGRNLPRVESLSELPERLANLDEPR